MLITILYSLINKYVHHMMVKSFYPFIKSISHEIDAIMEPNPC